MSGHTCPECGQDFPSSSCATGGSVGHDCPGPTIRVILETTMSDVQPGDLWFLEGAWVTVDAVTGRGEGILGNAIQVVYHQDDDDAGSEVNTDFSDFEVAIVKRDTLRP